MAEMAKNDQPNIYEEMARLRAEAQEAHEAAQAAEEKLAALEKQEREAYAARLDYLADALMKRIPALREANIPFEEPLTFGDTLHRHHATGDEYLRILPDIPFVTLQAGYERKGYWEQLDRIDQVNPSYRNDEQVILSIYFPRKYIKDLLEGYGLLAEEER